MGNAIFAWPAHRHLSIALRPRVAPRSAVGRRVGSSLERRLRAQVRDRLGFSRPILSFDWEGYSRIPSLFSPGRKEVAKRSFRGAAQLSIC